MLHVPHEDEILKVRSTTSSPYFEAFMEIDKTVSTIKKGRDGARFDFYLIGKYSNNWYNSRNLLEIRNLDTTMSLTSPKAKYEVVVRYTSSINTF